MKKNNIVFICLLASLSIRAQSKFLGTWILKDKQHINGPEYADALYNKIEILQAKDSIILHTSMVAPDGEIKGEQSYPLNGSVSSKVSPKTGRKLDKSLKWGIDKNTLILTTIIHKVGIPSEIEATRIESWSIDPSGKLLTIEKKSIESFKESWEAKATFQKQ